MTVGIWRDKTITALSGLSQTIAAANGSRAGLIVQNTGTAAVGVNLTGGAAALGGAGTLTLSPPGSTVGTNMLVFTGEGVPQSAITVIGTASQPCACLEL